jgi:lysozyme family protein
MALFEPAFALTLKNEGGYQNNPKDKGNFNSRGENVGTNFGISAPTLERYLGRVPSVADVKGLTKAVAADIYLKFYWNENYLGTIIDQDTANQLFDIDVLQGEGKLGRIAQEALNSIGYNVVQDGIFGPQTRQAINQVIADYRKDILNNTLVTVRKKYLQDANWPGWIPRAEEYLSTAVAQVKKKVFSFLRLL